MANDKKAFHRGAAQIETIFIVACIAINITIRYSHIGRDPKVSQSAEVSRA